MTFACYNLFSTWGKKMLKRCLAAEFLGTALLLATVVGSGALMHSLDHGNVAVTVFGVAFATGCVLFALIHMLGSISAHFNPIVTISSAIQNETDWQVVFPYICAQIWGAMAGVMLANLMFDHSAIMWSQTARTGAGQWLGEIVASFCLIGVIMGTSKFKPESGPSAVSMYVAGAILFTSSTCFANPAVTFARTLTATITGIQSSDVLSFVGCQLAGAFFALAFFDWLLDDTKAQTAFPEKYKLKKPVEQTEEDEELVYS